MTTSQSTPGGQDNKTTNGQGSKMQPERRRDYDSLRDQYGELVRRLDRVEDQNSRQLDMIVEHRGETRANQEATHTAIEALTKVVGEMVTETKLKDKMFDNRTKFIGSAGAILAVIVAIYEAIRH